ncbi:MBLC1 protein, partial [Alopecoenas beccarii]|nr:MBLC1 protein [Alopecoenas beccarii]
YRTAPLDVPSEIVGSPYTVQILQEGFCHPPLPDGSFRADGTITLVRGGPVTLLVDTGGPWGGGRRLLELLSHRGVSPENVTDVVCTHGHSDHVGNINLFPKAKVMVGLDLTGGDGWYLPHPVTSGGRLELDPGFLEVMATPGHTRDHVSVVVKGTSMGTVVVAGDTFERDGDEDEWRGLSEDPERQEKSRGDVVALADVIVPGHGPPFRVIKDGDE